MAHGEKAFSEDDWGGGDTRGICLDPPAKPTRALPRLRCPSSPQQTKTKNKHHEPSPGVRLQTPAPVKKARENQKGLLRDAKRGGTGYTSVRSVSSKSGGAEI